LTYVADLQTTIQELETVDTWMGRFKVSVQFSSVQYIHVYSAFTNVSSALP